MPRGQTAAAGRPGFYFDCTVGCCSHYCRLENSDRRCLQIGCLTACRQPRWNCQNRLLAAADDDETEDDCCNAVAAVDNAGNVAQ